MAFISHPRIAPDMIEDRGYQTALAEGCSDHNALVILPTGLGKTVVALRVIADSLGEGKVLMLAPTRPLVKQHHDFLAAALPGVRACIITGQTPPAARKEAIERSELIVSTPQCISNDLLAGNYSLDGFSLVIYDEAHRGIGNYAYVAIAEHCDRSIRCIGFTASPGSDTKRIEEICGNLSFSRIYSRSDEDPDVSPYVHDMHVQRIELNLPEEMAAIVSSLKGILDHYFGELTSLRLTNPGWPVSTKHMLAVGGTLQRRLAKGEKTAVVFRGLVVQAICVKLLHAINLAETQGITVLKAYLSRINEDGGETGSKGGRELTGRKDYREVWRMVSETNAEHPKISRIMSLVSRIVAAEHAGRIIVFTQYRDTCDLLVERISAIPGAKVAKLVGQANRGLRQKEQVRILEEFRAGVHNVLVSTSVGEEGLDIASTDAVIFYEPVPSEIRTIQRRGRTGRRSTGEVFVLVTKGTLDEVFDESSKKKEELMRTRLESLNESLMRRDAEKRTRELQRRIGEF